MHNIIVLNAGRTLGVIVTFDTLPLDSHWKPDLISQQTSYGIDNNMTMCDYPIDCALPSEDYIVMTCE